MKTVKMLKVHVEDYVVATHPSDARAMYMDTRNPVTVSGSEYPTMLEATSSDSYDALSTVVEQRAICIAGSHTKEPTYFIIDPRLSDQFFHPVERLNEIIKDKSRMIGWLKGEVEEINNQRQLVRTYNGQLVNASDELRKSISNASLLKRIKYLFTGEL